MADTETKKMKRKHLKLYSKATFTGYKRGLRNQYETFALLKLEGTFNKEDAKHYLGKRCVYVYKGKNKSRVPGAPNQHKNRLRAMWGKVVRIHGNSGSVRAQFKRNLPPNAMGKTVRVMMYPSRSQ
ncbi:60S ribosomal protein L35a-like [Amphibalanus amphitrite]|nr:60S ribosomal protein L35a-like [Amphibalanus amphitrite]